MKTDCKILMAGTTTKPQNQWHAECTEDAPCWLGGRAIVSWVATLFCSLVAFRTYILSLKKSFDENLGADFFLPELLCLAQPAPFFSPSPPIFSTLPFLYFFLFRTHAIVSNHRILNSPKVPTSAIRRKLYSP